MCSTPFLGSCPSKNLHPRALETKPHFAQEGWGACRPSEVTFITNYKSKNTQESQYSCQKFISLLLLRHNGTIQRNVYRGKKSLQHSLLFIPRTSLFLTPEHQEETSKSAKWATFLTSIISISYVCYQQCC